MSRQPFCHPPIKSFRADSVCPSRLQRTRCTSGTFGFRNPSAQFAVANSLEVLCLASSHQSCMCICIYVYISICSCRFWRSASFPCTLCAMQGRRCNTLYVVCIQKYVHASVPISVSVLIHTACICLMLGLVRLGLLKFRVPASLS